MLLRGRRAGPGRRRRRASTRDNDIAVLRVDGLDAPALELARDPKAGTSAAILGFPLNGPYDVRPGAARPDARGRSPRTPTAAGPVRRRIASLRGRRALRQLRRADGRRRRARRRDGLRGHHAAARAAATACRTTSCAPRSSAGRAVPRAPAPGRPGRMRARPCDPGGTGPLRAGRALPCRDPWARPSSSPRSRPSAATSRACCRARSPSTRAILESDSHVVTWAVGHLVQLAEPDEYDPKFKKWRMADLPIVPDEFKLVVRDERSRKQMSVITQAAQARRRRRGHQRLRRRPRGRADLRLDVREGGREEARPAAVAVVDDHAGDPARRSARCARARSSRRSRRPPARARRRTGSSA